MGHDVDLTCGDGFVLPAWVARPAGAPCGAVVVLQEIYGVNAHIRSVAERFAASGYLAVAPALFARVKPGVELGYGPEDMQAGMALKAAATSATSVQALPAAAVMQDIQAAIDYAAQHSARKVGCVGFCWGGLLSWRAACALQGLSAAVSYYGGGMTTAEELARQPRVPVLAHFGAHDHWIAVADVQTFSQAHPGVVVQIYPAGHGFNCDQRGSYHQPSAVSAHERTLAFLGQHLV